MNPTTEIPPLVQRALRTSLELGYIQTTRTETGRLLMVLAASCTGPIAECGSGCGVGAAWLRSGAPVHLPVLTAELDPDLAERARQTLEADGVQVVNAQFKTLEPYGPFSLIYADMQAAAEAADLDIADQVLMPGGLFVIDELEGLDANERLAADHPLSIARRAWLTDPRFTATEIRTAPDAPVLVITKRVV